MNVYTGKSLWRPGGAHDGQLITAEHDMAMSNAMISKLNIYRRIIRVLSHKILFSWSVLH
jgi:hypothetical protein